jgi:hypothetical protein
MKEEQNSQSSQYTLLNISNFNKIMTSSIKNVLEKYVLLIIEYNNFISEKINIKNKKYYEFIYNRGLDTISHVFSMILFYTKNLDITYYHSQKSFYFYVEFIEQIIDIQHSFLQLSSRDASIFVYKKTIYEINNEYRKSIDSNKETNANELEIINLYIEIYKLLVKLKPIQLKDVSLKMEKNYDTYNKKTIHIIYLFVEKMIETNDIIKFDTFMFFLNSLEKNTINEEKLNNLKCLIFENEVITEVAIKNIFN